MGFGQPELRDMNASCTASLSDTPTRYPECDAHLDGLPLRAGPSVVFPGAQPWLRINEVCFASQFENLVAPVSENSVCKTGRARRRVARIVFDSIVQFCNLQFFVTHIATSESRLTDDRRLLLCY